MPVSATDATVMIVDDVPENLTLLSAILRKENYRVVVFSHGVSALQAVEANPPDIILLDISMPEMDGYQVCQTLKSNENFCSIPVIFISALSQVQEKVKGFEVGGQDYITKPFQVREVLERVRTHLDLAWTRRELEETLDQTLTGSLKLVTDFLGFVNPNAFSRGIRIKQYMTGIVERLDLEPKRWYELAAVLSQLGPAAVSPALQEKYTLQKLSPGEKEQINRSIEFVAILLKGIPRLEPVADMINHHNVTLKMTGNKPLDELNTAERGGMILNILQQYDRLSLRGMPSHEIIELMRREGNFPKILYEALQECEKTTGNWETLSVPISKLISGMILEEDIKDIEDRVLLKRGVKLSNIFVEALKFQIDRLEKKSVLVKSIRIQ